MFRGSIVALATPMLANGDIDENALRELANWHVEQGSDGIGVMGTTGESATCSPAEQLQAIKIVMQEVRERVPVIAGTATISTRKTIELTTAAMQEGVDACLIMTPAYVKPTQQGLFEHYQMIAREVAIPQILYNVPGRTAVDLLPETLARLVDVPNIIGIKEATGNLERARQVIEIASDKLDVYSGDDETCMDLMLLGGKGVISVAANVAPRVMHEMAHAAADGHRDEAMRLNEQCMPLHRALFLESNPIPVKWALAKMGKCQPHLRLPLTPLSEVHHDDVLAALKQAKCLS